VAKRSTFRDLLVVVRGTGSIGCRYLRVLRDRLGVRVVAVPTRPARIRELLEQGVEAVGSVNEIDHSGRVACIVATDTGRHVSDAIELLHLGDVLIEKPISATTRGLTRLMLSVQTSGRRAYVAHHLRFAAGLAYVRSALPSLGAIDAVRVVCQSFLPDWRPHRHYRHSYAARPDEGGVLRDLVHEIDYVGSLLGFPSRVFAMLRNRARLGIAAEEAADLLWVSPAGASVSVRLDYITRHARRTLWIGGERGDLEWDLLASTGVLHLAGRAAEHSRFPDERDDVIERMLKAFLAGRPEACLASLEEGALAVALLDAARRSSASGCWESVQDWRQG